MSAIDWIEREDGNESFVKDLKITPRDGKFIIIFLCTRQKISTNQFSWVWGLKN